MVNPFDKSARFQNIASSPVAFLWSITFVNWFGFAAWQALLNNFAKESAGFTGFEIGLLQSIREIPGFLAFTAVFLFLFMREQALAYVSLLILGLGVAVSGYFPTVPGLLATTFLMSVGFHYFETANQAIALQILSKEQAPKVLGKTAGAAAAAQLAAYGIIAAVWLFFAPSFPNLYLLMGALTILLTLAVVGTFRRFDGPVPQNKGIVLRKRYWLYYAMTFVSGARRQIFMAFGAWLLVERFGFTLFTLSGLLFAFCVINLFAAPLLGQMIARIGERNTIVIENLSLIVVFVGYATTTSAAVAGALFMLDGVFFTLMIAQKTYFQKIADPADIAPTASVAFTINHIAAVVIPVIFGAIWIRNPAIVFEIGAGIAGISLLLSFLVPRRPEPGREPTLAGPARAAAPAE